MKRLRGGIRGEEEEEVVVQSEEDERDAKVFYKLHVRLTQHASVRKSRRARVINLTASGRVLCLCFASQRGFRAF